MNTEYPFHFVCLFVCLPFVSGVVFVLGASRENNTTKPTISVDQNGRGHFAAQEFL